MSYNFLVQIEIQQCLDKFNLNCFNLMSCLEKDFEYQTREKKFPTELKYNNQSNADLKINKKDFKFNRNLCEEIISNSKIENHTYQIDKLVKFKINLILFIFHLE